MSDNTLTSLEVYDVTQVEDYLIETSKECEVFQIEPEIVIALNEREDEMKINVNSDKPEMPQIESEEDQPLVLVQPFTLPCTFDDVRLINFLPKSKGKQVGIMDSKHIIGRSGALLTDVVPVVLVSPSVSGALLSLVSVLPSLSSCPTRTPLLFDSSSSSRLCSVVVLTPLLSSSRLCSVVFLTPLLPGRPNAFAPSSSSPSRLCSLVVLALLCSLVALPCSGRCRVVLLQSCSFSVRASAPLGSHIVLSFSPLFDLSALSLCSYSVRASLCFIADFTADLFYYCSTSSFKSLSGLGCTCVASPPEHAWRRRLNSHANLLREFSVTFREAVKMSVALSVGDWFFDRVGVSAIDCPYPFTLWREEVEEEVGVSKQDKGKGVVQAKQKQKYAGHLLNIIPIGVSIREPRLGRAKLKE
ncbi:hypothetical protein Syun_027900 [Stephania yunnanensis]|uniref:Uncharacterized protein n=1 Tax=Stephania yunnanensis TaxID=152371 RepID=A0AAP0EGS3_9MAGN